MLKKDKAGTNIPQSKIQLNPEDLMDIVCENCGCRYFKQVNIFKRISALVSHTGKEQIIPIPTFRCDDCGHINDEFQTIKQAK